jgi:hypothetical protein
MSANVFMPNVKYLEITDITPDWKLKPYVNDGKPAIVMVQGNFCGWCTKAKPDYARFQNNSKVAVCAIQSDGAESERELYKGLRNWDPEFSGGVPCYYLFNPDGSYNGKYSGGRDEQSLRTFFGA